MHIVTAVESKSERLVGRVKDSQNLQQRYDDSSCGLCSSCSPPDSYSVFNIPHGVQHQMRPVISVGASDRPEQLEPVVHPRFTGKALTVP